MDAEKYKKVKNGNKIKENSFVEKDKFESIK